MGFARRLLCGWKATRNALQVQSCSRRAPRQRPPISIKANGTLGEGVYYATVDYAGILRRALGQAVDLGVTLFVGWVLFSAFAAGPPQADGFRKPFLMTLAFAYIYLTVIKPSPLRSLGYMLTDTKVVTLRGQRPSILRMTFRLLLWILGPFNVLYDLIWMGISDDRQCLRDMYAGTYVIKAHAQPAGRGNIHLAPFFALGYALMYPKVTRGPVGVTPSTPRSQDGPPLA
jgi:uncharacterized RDD family membrane protein YckC